MIELIAGLGNPGEEYRNSRHNLGFMVLDEVLRRLTPVSKVNQPEYVIVEAALENGEKVHLTWPQTFVNRSGLAVGKILDLYHLQPKQMLVVVDDFYLPLAVLRFRSEGGDGGHNGLASIISEIGQEAFPRLRLGTGPLPEDEDPTNYVLRTFTESELEPIKKMVAKAAEGVIFSLRNRFELAMSKYNSINPALSEND